MLKLYNYTPSGNCYKVRLLLNQLRIPFESVEVKLRMTPEVAREFKQINPLGRVPALVLDSGEVLGESNAILCHFADGTPLLPDLRLERTRVLQWLFWEQYDHEPTVAVVRAWVKYFGVPEGKAQELISRRAGAYKALDVMESHLRDRAFMVAERYTIADIALFAYTHVCEEGEMSLEAYPAIRSWIARVQAQPGHVPLSA